MKNLSLRLFNLSKREKSVLYFAIGILLFSLVYTFILEPMLKKWTRLGGQILVKETKLKKNLRIISQREFIQSEYAKFVNFIETGGTDEEKITKLLGEIEGKANGAFVHITDIKPRQTKDFRDYRRFTVDLEIEASMENLSKFVYDLYSSSQFLRIEKLQLNAKGSQSNILNCHMLITKLD